MNVGNEALQGKFLVSWLPWEELQAAIRQGQSSNLDPSQLRPARSALEQEIRGCRLEVGILKI